MAEIQILFFRLYLLNFKFYLYQRDWEAQQENYNKHIVVWILQRLAVEKPLALEKVLSAIF